MQEYCGGRSGGEFFGAGGSRKSENSRGERTPGGVPGTRWWMAVLVEQYRTALSSLSLSTQPRDDCPRGTPEGIIMDSS